MVSTITEKTGLPIGMVIALVTAVVTIAAGYFDTRAAVARNSSDLAEMKAAQKEAGREIQTIQLRTQRNEDAFASLLTAFGRIEAKFDRVLTVRPAGGR